MVQGLLPGQRTPTVPLPRSCEPEGRNACNGSPQALKRKRPSFDETWHGYRSVRLTELA